MSNPSSHPFAKSQFYFSLFFLSIFILLLSSTYSAEAISPDIVISQVYGGGGNGGATYTHDFIELFNRGTTAVSLTGWSVQYASATGTGNFGANSGQLTELPNISLAPGQYLLVQEVSSGAVGSPLPTPDVTDLTPISMGGTAGKVAVVNSTASLGCNGGSNPCSAAQLAMIVDLVGYGNANFFEGSAAAPGLSSTTAALRAADGCTETDDNAADFTDDMPNPRNTASPFNVCGGSGDLEIIITEIMYDPNSTEDNWEWIEIYNAGSSSVDLAGFVVDDNNSVVHTAANIAGGTLAAGEQAILYNADDVSAANFAAAWGSVNLIPVTNWAALALNNTGDQVSLWASFADYTGDNVAHANAFDTVNYGSAGFPDPVGASIYLTDLSADNNVGSNWATSTNGGATPLFTGYTSAAAGGNVGTDVGSPGTLVVATEVIINEIMQNPAAVADNSGEWFELYNPTAAAIDINGWTIADNGTNSHVINNGGPLLIPAGGYLVLGNNTDSGTNGGAPVAYSYGGSWALGNGDDEVVLFDTVLNEIDRVEYDGGPTFPDPTGASMSLSDPNLDNNVGANWCTSVTPFGAGDLGTPGAENACEIVEPPLSCDDASVITFIHDIQGPGLTSPIVGSNVVIDGVVVGDFQNNASADNGDLNGFYVQEEDADADGSTLTSEGIFVFAPGATDVSNGDHVRVKGTISEFSTSGGSQMTELSNVTIALCIAPAVAPAATNVTFPLSAVSDLEQYEGMLVTFPQALSISEYFNFDRFNEVVLSLGRQYQGTAVAEPGAPANAVAAANALARITLDDGRSTQNSDPALHPNGSTFDLNNLFRGGDTVENTTGVIDETFGLYRIQPTQAPTYSVENPRQTTPPAVGGSLTVASFNVLNYFSTLDMGAPICGPAGNQDCRGANNANEFNRQRTKIIAALADIDADIFGLIELENHATDAALIDLVTGLNDLVGAGTYSYIATGPIGTDAIKVALIYKSSTVTPLGTYQVLDSSVDPRFIDTLNRPVLAQTFMQNANGALLTVAVNHLKSKGSDCNSVGDPDTGDGQGNCNLTRLAAAQALVDWLATDPTGSGDSDFLLIGDFNSYDKEDPIDAILAGPDDTTGTNDDYTDLNAAFNGELAYSYVFDGQLGYLDYGLSSNSLTAQVTGVTDWHINGDEPDILDYNTDFKQPAQQAIFEANAFRSSDHDPVIVGLDLIATCNGLPATIVGTPGSTEIQGTNGPDVIVALSGNETIYGGNGNDVICGNGGNDKLYGGNGNDILLGSFGDDILDGGNGDDTLSGGDGMDELSGQNGNDSLSGGSGNDALSGGKGDDTLTGGADADSFSGGQGNDTNTDFNAGEGDTSDGT